MSEENKKYEPLEIEYAEDFKKFKKVKLHRLDFVFQFKLPNLARSAKILEALDGQNKGSATIEAIGAAIGLCWGNHPHIVSSKFREFDTLNDYGDEVLEALNDRFDLNSSELNDLGFVIFEFLSKRYIPLQEDVEKK